MAPAKHALLALALAAAAAAGVINVVQYDTPAPRAGGEPLVWAQDLPHLHPPVACRGNSCCCTSERDGTTMCHAEAAVAQDLCTRGFFKRGLYQPHMVLAEKPPSTTATAAGDASLSTGPTTHGPPTTTDTDEPTITGVTIHGPPTTLDSNGQTVSDEVVDPSPIPEQDGPHRTFSFPQARAEATSSSAAMDGIPHPVVPVPITLEATESHAHLQHHTTDTPSATVSPDSFMQLDALPVGPWPAISSPTHHTFPQARDESPSTFTPKPMTTGLGGTLQESFVARNTADPSSSKAASSLPYASTATLDCASFKGPLYTECLSWVSTSSNTRHTSTDTATTSKSTLWSIPIRALDEATAPSSSLPTAQPTDAIHAKHNHSSTASPAHTKSKLVDHFSDQNTPNKLHQLEKRVVGKGLWHNGTTLSKATKTNSNTHSSAAHHTALTPLPKIPAAALAAVPPPDDDNDNPIATHHGIPAVAPRWGSPPHFGVPDTSFFTYRTNFHNGGVMVLDVSKDINKTADFPAHYQTGSRIDNKPWHSGILWPSSRLSMIGWHTRCEAHGAPRAFTQRNGSAPAMPHAATNVPECVRRHGHAGTFPCGNATAQVAQTLWIDHAQCVEACAPCLQFYAAQGRPKASCEARVGFATCRNHYWDFIL